MPRGLYFEDGFGESGIIVCGLNPGTSRDEERNFYRENDVSYRSLYRYWHEHHPSIQYFLRVRNFVRGLGYTGPILWTNIAKCEKAESSKRIGFATNLQTFRSCASSYLTSEIEGCPDSWPLVANGKEAFTALSYLFPTRRVIGIAHPTGAYPQFSKMLNGGQVRSEVRDTIQTYFEEAPIGALWLCGARWAQFLSAHRSS